MSSLLMVLAAESMAANVFVRLQPAELVQGQVGQAIVTVVSESKQDAKIVGTPSVKADPSLVLRAEGRSQKYQSYRGNYLLATAFTFSVAAPDAGTFEIGPATVKLDNGQEISTGPVQLVVTERPEGAPAQEVIVKAGFRESEVWEGQVVHYQFRVDARNATGTNWDLPNLEGTRQPQLGEPERKQFTLKDEDVRIMVDEGTIPLVVTGTGKRDYDPAIVTVRMPLPGGRNPYGLIRTRSDPHVGEPTSLTIRALPTPPPDATGLVGEFELYTQLGREEGAQGRPRVGESLNWKVVVAGDGAVEGFQPTPPEIDGASVYADKEDNAARVLDGEYRSRAEFNWTLVPTRPGTLDLGTLEFVVFSPKEGKYVTMEASVAPFEVEPGAEGDAEGMKSFAQEENVEAAERQRRGDVHRWGRASAPWMGATVPIGWFAAAVPGLALLSWEGFRLLASRRTKREPTTAERLAELLGELPPTGPSRLAALSRGLRMAKELFRTEEQRARAAELASVLGRARFADDDRAAQISDEVVAFLREVMA